MKYKKKTKVFLLIKLEELVKVYTPVSNLHDFFLWVLRERIGVKQYSGRYALYICNTLRISLHKPCLRGTKFPAPLGWQGLHL